MTKEEVISALAGAKRSEVARGTGLRYMYLYRVEKGLIKNPGSDQIDKLRDWFSSQPQQHGARTQ